MLKRFMTASHTSIPSSYLHAVKRIFGSAHLVGSPYAGREKLRMRRLLEVMGNPHLNAAGEPRFRVVHVAGTNGKGHTTALVDSALRSLGYRTGLFTSPHLHSVRERIRVNGNLIPPAEFSDLVDRLDPAFLSVGCELTAFDKLTAMALQHFADRSVEWAVLEVGMGGRLDSTNALPPQSIAVCGINAIGLEHQHVLGHSLNEIASEKAGIIKPGCPVVTVPHRGEEVLPVIADVAKNAGVVLSVALPLSDADLERQGVDIPNLFPSESHDLGHEHWLDVINRANYEEINRGLSAVLIRTLVERGLVRNDLRSIVNGLRGDHCYWPGRFERLQHPDKHVLVDCAHNMDAVQLLLERLRNEYGSQDVVLVMGVNSDKAIVPILRQCLEYPRVTGMIFTASKHPKALLPHTLLASAALEMKELGKNVHLKVVESPGDAVKEAMSMSNSSVTVVTGSVFVVAETREWWNAEFNQFPPGDFCHAAEIEPDVNEFWRF